MDDDFFQVLDAAFEFVQPSGRALQRFGGLGIKHQEAVDVADAGVAVHIGGEQGGVLRFGAAVAAYIEIPAFFSGDDAEIFTLRFGTFADAAGYAGFEFVRRAQAFVAVFQINGEADRVLYAVAAPCAADAGFHRAQGFAVGVAAFETGCNQLFPNGG